MLDFTKSMTRLTAGTVVVRFLPVDEKAGHRQKGSSGFWASEVLGLGFGYFGWTKHMQDLQHVLFSRPRLESLAGCFSGSSCQAVLPRR